MNKADFLAAMPSLSCPIFGKSVILMRESEEENMDKPNSGIILNKAISSRISDLIDMGRPISNMLNDVSLVLGGPISYDKLIWILHDKKIKVKNSLKIHSQLYISPIEDFTVEVKEKEFKNIYHIGMGYAGWEEKQLDREIEEGSWWKFRCDPLLILSTPIKLRWQKLFEVNGVDVSYMHDVQNMSKLSD